jgi:hypothetical protein
MEALHLLLHQGAAGVAIGVAIGVYDVVLGLLVAAIDAQHWVGKDSP